MGEGLPYSTCAKAGMQNVRDESSCMTAMGAMGLSNYEWQGTAPHLHMGMGCIVARNQDGTAHGYWVTHHDTEAVQERDSVLCMEIQGKNQ